MGRLHELCAQFNEEVKGNPSTLMVYDVAKLRMDINSAQQTEIRTVGTASDRLSNMEVTCIAMDGYLCSRGINKKAATGFLAAYQAIKEKS
jgi:hypothetical protein